MSADVYAEDGYYAVIPEWVLDSGVSSRAVHLYAVLRRYADQRSGLAHPSRKTLADRVGVKDEKTVDRALEELAEVGAVSHFGRWLTAAGEVVYEPVEGHVGRTSNGYRIHRHAAKNGGGTGTSAPTPPPTHAPRVGAPEGEEPQPTNHSQLNEGTRKRATSAPDTFELTSEMESWALDVTSALGVEPFATAELQNVTQRFLAHHQAKGSTFKRWDRAWQNWVRGDAARRRKPAPAAAFSVNGTKLPAGWS